jgi:hypothetical protein
MTSRRRMSWAKRLRWLSSKASRTDPVGPRNVPATIKLDQVRQKSLNGAALSSL